MTMCHTLLIAGDPWITLASSVAEVLVKGSAVLFLASLLALLLRKASAARRELVWRLAWIGCAALPFLCLGLPSWSWDARDPSAGVAGATAGLPPMESAQPSTAGFLKPLSAQPTENAKPAAARLPRPAAEDSPTRRSASPFPTAGCVRAALVAWFFGALLSLVPLILGSRRLRQVLAAAEPLREEGWSSTLESLRATIGLRRCPVLCQSPLAPVPLLHHSWLRRRSLLVLPAAAECWTEERRRAVLLHELAHLRRRDGPVQRLARVAASFAWPNPLAWVGLRALVRDAERAADDVVITSGVFPSAYARHLLEIARLVPSRGEPAALRMAGRSDLGGRLRAILNPRCPRQEPGRSTFLLALSLLVLALSPLAMLRQVAAQAPAGLEAVGEPVEQEELRQARDRGLDYLRLVQHADTGGWPGDLGFKFSTSYRTTSRAKPHVGVTALVLLAFLEAGHLPGEGPHGEALRRGTGFLLACLEDGLGYINAHGSRMKSHGLAMLYLSRLRALKNELVAAEELQQAVDFTKGLQLKGGWRYLPLSEDPDVLGTVCQLQALQAARAAGLQVPAAVLQRAENYLRGLWDRKAGSSNFGTFRYQAEEGARTTFGCTAAALAALAAWSPEELPAVREAARWLEREKDRLPVQSPGHFFFWHGHYYASQVFHRAARLDPAEGGPRWDAYHRWLQAELLALQKADGSWPCSAGPGSAFATAVACLLLASG